MTKAQVQMLTTDNLWALVRSPSALGGMWLELSWAKEELQRRASIVGKRHIGL